MIGIIQNTKIFEFRDESDLSRALEWLGDRYDCEIVMIVDPSDKVKGVVHRGYFTWPTRLNEGQKYYIYGSNSADDKELQSNEVLPKRYNWDLGPFSFIYGEQRLPKELSF